MTGWGDALSVNPVLVLCVTWRDPVLSQPRSADRFLEQNTVDEIKNDAAVPIEAL